ncbi:hypothetical protein [Aquimarina agarivorans]|uniref:hypothetical protein n=1 Tax=Aquimarina agarivorans TaxID=980584 RepID=UPI000248FAE8|nr:hypothetical protein [Aquimarina agarivorans]
MCNFSRSTFKNSILLFSTIIIVLLGIHWITSTVLKHKLVNALHASPKITLNYLDIDFNLFTGSITVKDLHFIEKNQKLQTILDITANKLEIKYFNYWDYFNKKELNAETVYLDTPKLCIYQRPKTKNQSRVKKKIPLAVKNLTLKDGVLQLFENNKKNPEFKIQQIDLNLLETSIPNINNVQSPASISYEQVSANFDDLFLRLSDLDVLIIQNVAIQNDHATFKNTDVKTIYGKRELSSHLKHEKDHISLTVPKIEVDKWAILNRDTLNTFYANDIQILQADLNLFRDKAVVDNTVYKSLYGEKMKQLNFKMELPKINVINGKITYEQLIEDNDSAGKLFFTNVNANLGLSNLSEAKHQIKCKASAHFMGDSPVTLETTFNANPKTNFVATGSFSNFDGSSVNSFLETNLQTRIKGAAEKIYFNINGNNYKAFGDVKLKYKELSIEILRKDVLKVNKLLTALGNFIIHKNDSVDVNGYRHGKIDIERDQTKSYFNFLWISLKDGLINALTNKK